MTLRTAERNNPVSIKLPARTFITGFINRLLVLFFLLVLTFALPRLMPGDPLELLVSSDAVRALTELERQTLRQQLGLEGNIVHQFAAYCSALLRGDLGYSVAHAASVSHLLLTSLPWTLLLIIGAMPVYLVVGISLGIEAGRHPHGRVDRVLTPVLTLFSSIPPFLLALFLLLFLAIIFPLFPLGGAHSVFPPQSWHAKLLEIGWYAALPCIALAGHEVTRFYFLSRGEAVNLSRRPFVINARARGVSNTRERLNYFARNMLPIAVARMSDSIATLIGSVLYVEITFSYPGIGLLIYSSVLERDFAVLQGAVLFLAAGILAVNWLIDSVSAAYAQRG